MASWSTVEQDLFERVQRELGDIKPDDPEFTERAMEVAEKLLTEECTKRGVPPALAQFAIMSAKASLLKTIVQPVPIPEDEAK